MVLKAVALWVSLLVFTTSILVTYVKVTFHHRSKTRLRFKLRNFSSLWVSEVLLLLISYLHMCELSTHFSAKRRVGAE